MIIVLSYKVFKEPKGNGRGGIFLWNLKQLVVKYNVISVT